MLMRVGHDSCSSFYLLTGLEFKTASFGGNQTAELHKRFWGKEQQTQPIATH